MQLPQKLQSGMQFKPSVVKTINDIISYLHTQRLVTDNKTIKITQLTSGVAISAVQNPSVSPGGTSTDFDYPFKMTIGTLSEQGQDDTQVLHIKRGRISLNGDDQSRIYVCYQPNEDNFDQYVPLPDEQGVFEVNLCFFYDQNTQSPNQDYWEVRVVYTEAGSNTHDWTNSAGFFVIVLGEITVTQNENNQLVYAITRQQITSGFSVFDCDVNTHFKAWFKTTTYPNDGDILDDPIIPEYIVINAGNVMSNGRYLNAVQSWFQLPQNLENADRIYCVQVNTVANLVGFRVFSSNELVFTEDNITFNIPICRLIVGGASAVGVQQLIIGDFCFAIDDKKVKLNSADEIPNFIEEKIKIPTTDFSSLDSENQSFYSAYPNNSFIKAIRFSDSSNFSMSSLSSAELSTYWDQVYWGYKDIPNWSGNSSSSSNLQTIYNENSVLKWFDYGKIRINTNDPSPDFLDSKIVVGQFLYKAIDTENFKWKIWTRALKQGFNVTLTDGNQGDDTEKPYVKLDCYKTTVRGLSGIKCDQTKTDQNHTLSYSISIDYPNFALEIDSSIASLLDIEKSAGGIKIKSALQGSGLMAVSGGNISLIPAPNGNAVLACSNGAFSWLPYADCDSACSSASSAVS